MLHMACMKTGEYSEDTEANGVHGATQDTGRGGNRIVSQVVLRYSSSQ